MVTTSKKRKKEKQTAKQKNSFVSSLFLLVISRKNTLSHSDNNLIWKKLRPTKHTSKTKPFVITFSVSVFVNVVVVGVF